MRGIKRPADLESVIVEIDVKPAPFPHNPAINEAFLLQHELLDAFGSAVCEVDLYGGYVMAMIDRHTFCKPGILTDLVKVFI